MGLREEYLKRTLGEIKKPEYVTQDPGLGGSLAAIGKALDFKTDPKKGLMENIQSGLTDGADALRQAYLQKQAYEQGQESIQEQINKTSDPRLQAELLKDLEQAKSERSLQQQAYEAKLGKQTDVMGQVARQQEEDAMKREEMLKDISLKKAELGQQERLQTDKLTQDNYAQLVKQGMRPEEAFTQAQIMAQKEAPLKTRGKYSLLGLRFGKGEIDPKALKAYLANKNVQFANK